MSCIQCDGNFLIDRTVTLDCHRKKRNLSIGWIDIKMGQDSIDHGWLEEIMLLHRFPAWVCSTVRNLSRGRNSRIVVTTKKGRDASQTIMFREGLP